MLASTTILSIDPGTSCTGTSILTIDERGVQVQFVETINAVRLLPAYQHIAHIHGDRVARIVATGEQIRRLLHLYQPHYVVSESPYMGRFATSFGALTELVFEIRRQVMAWNYAMPLETIEPSVVKRFVGVSGQSGDKEEMKKAVLNKDISYSEFIIHPAALDEHSIDAIAVGLCFIGRSF